MTEKDLTKDFISTKLNYYLVSLHEKSKNLTNEIETLYPMHHTHIEFLNRLKITNNMINEFSKAYNNFSEQNNIPDNIDKIIRKMINDCLTKISELDKWPFDNQLFLRCLNPINIILGGFIQTIEPMEEWTIEELISNGFIIIE